MRLIPTVNVTAAAARGVSHHGKRPSSAASESRRPYHVGCSEELAGMFLYRGIGAPWPAFTATPTAVAMDAATADALASSVEVPILTWRRKPILRRTLQYMGPLRPETVWRSTQRIVPKRVSRRFPRVTSRRLLSKTNSSPRWRTTRRSGDESSKSNASSIVSDCQSERNLSRIEGEASCMSANAPVERRPSGDAARRAAGATGGRSARTGGYARLCLDHFHFCTLYKCY